MARCTPLLAALGADLTDESAVTEAAAREAIQQKIGAVSKLAEQLAGLVGNCSHLMEGMAMGQSPGQAELRDPPPRQGQVQMLVSVTTDVLVPGEDPAAAANPWASIPSEPQAEVFG